MKRKPILISILILLSVVLFSLIHWDIPVQDLKVKYTNTSSKFMDIDGIQVHYRDEGKGMPLVLIHGTGASLHTWDNWTEILKSNHRVIRMDLPAFGLTGPHPKKNYSINSYTNFLTKFFSKLQIDSLYLAGNSLGGNIAWNYAADHQNNVKKLILIDPSGYPTGKKPSFIFRIAKTPILNSIVRYITPKSIIRKNLKQVYFDDQKVTEELVDRYHELALREGNRQAFIDRVKTSFKNNTKKLKTLYVETLVLWGAEDQWIPVHLGDNFVQDIPSSNLVVVPNTGHVPMEESPKESIKPVIDFLKKE
ncbi:alpha/beta hydrolase [Aquimarina gracilis]|uniref:Alpha/beta hydrolase n=1 Tax=Aquimarina gracilis TaxID=874422 RepID=A0ABU5ZWX3_9FLAO|nr:alpha/beta hydrolase [Aquimarina gracilis]MEB3346376.1 alpha/beta hydrolase [Aquimarina gracilis]